MLVPAILYKEEIHNLFSAYYYSDDMMLYSEWLGSELPSIGNESDGNNYQFAIIDDDNKLIGYFTYQIDWYASSASRFGLFTFHRKNKIVGLDAWGELRKIINVYKIHRIEWRMVGGNPVEKHYDRFCKRYNGKKMILTDALRDKKGNYHNDIIYEIII